MADDTTVTKSVGLFGRQCEITLVPQNAPDNGDVLVIRGLRVQFKITMATGKATHAAKIVITNLNAEHRAYLQRGVPLLCQLIAGYTGALEQVYSGTIVRCWNQREKTDWETHLEVEDGAALRFGRLKKVLGNTTKGAAASAVVDGAEQVGIRPGNAREVLGKSLAKTADLIKCALTSSIADCMDKTFKSLAAEWTITNGEFNVVKKGQGLGKEAVVLSPTTGLVGSVEIGKHQKNDVVKCRSLIRPGLTPLRIVRLKSSYVNGDFRVEKAVYHGDTRGDEWYVDLELSTGGVDPSAPPTVDGPEPPETDDDESGPEPPTKTTTDAPTGG